MRTFCPSSMASNPSTSTSSSSSSTSLSLRMPPGRTLVEGTSAGCGPCDGPGLIVSRDDPEPASLMPGRGGGAAARGAGAVAGGAGGAGFSTPALPAREAGALGETARGAVALGEAAREARDLGEAAREARAWEDLDEAAREARPLEEAAREAGALEEPAREAGALDLVREAEALEGATRELAALARFGAGPGLFARVDRERAPAAFLAGFLDGLTRAHPQSRPLRDRAP